MHGHFAPPYIFERRECIMKLSFKDQRANVITTDINTEDAAQSVRAFVSAYFAKEDVRFDLATSLAILAHFTAKDCSIDTNQYRSEILHSAEFSKAIADVEAFFTDSIHRHVLSNDSSADIWWEYIQKLMKEQNAPTIEREMFMSDEPIVPLSNEIKVLLPNRTSYTIDRRDVFNSGMINEDQFSAKRAFAKFADSYIRENYDDLSAMFAHLVREAKIADDFAAFLKSMHTCVEDEMFLAVAEIEEFCDPIRNYCVEHNIENK